MSCGHYETAQRSLRERSDASVTQYFVVLSIPTVHEWPSCVIYLWCKFIIFPCLHYSKNLGQYFDTGCFAPQLIRIFIEMQLNLFCRDVRKEPLDIGDRRVILFIESLF